MDAKTIADTLRDKKLGQFFSVTMQRPAKTLKGVTEVVEKRTTMMGQLCDYARRGAVVAAVKDGTRDEPELPSHISHSFNDGNVKFWAGNNGKTYLPVPLAGKSTVTWFLNGQEVDYAQVEPFLLAADKPKERKDADELAESGQVPFVGIDIENILEVK